MRLQKLPLDQTVGHILCHNLADVQGRKAFVKGHRIGHHDLVRLRELGIDQLRVAVIDPDDVHENEAAARLALLACGPGLSAGQAHTGRVNLRVDGEAATDAPCNGLLRVEPQVLAAMNDIDGLTIASLTTFTPLRPGRIVATIKVIPFAVPEAALAAAAELAAKVPAVLAVQPFQRKNVGLVLVSSPAARRRLERGVYPAIVERVEHLSGRVVQTCYADNDEESVAAAIAELRGQRVELIIVAGETSIVDIDDVTPAGIRLAGGRIEHYGAPVEPGNLLLMAYLDEPEGMLPVLGAPGCVRSRSTNIVDLILPRLMAGEQVRRQSIVALGHGGLLG
jgi:hypothetical protein